ncbi:AFF1 protein, partial [Chunga burmeisteri]|nr:AFF1 protein [Chunga burmeisteri]
SLYNEDRNLLRIREKERRNQEALQEKDKFPEKTPLFAEPYKTNKEDELSSRIQNMLGNYEEVKEFISNKSHQNLIGIPTSVAPMIPQGKPDRPNSPEKTSHTLPSSFHCTTHHPPMGPTVVAPPPPSHSMHYQKAQSGTEPASGLHAKSHSLPNSRSQGQEHNRGNQESHTDLRHKRSDRRATGDGHANELQTSLLSLSPLLSSLCSPLPPLSPLHSSQHINSRSQNSSKSHGPTFSQTKSSQDLVVGSQEKESRDSSAINLTSTTQPSSQTFPPPLPSKTSAMQQKPTAYVRPMDGQDQAPVESPELKPVLEEYHREPYEKISDLKANAKAKLSKLEIPSEPMEQTFPSDVQSIEEILKEMTHSWPPPLTAIHTPSTAEPSKFPFPTKESQHVGSVAQNQKQYDAPSKTLPSSQPRTSMLQDDLQISDSEESGDDQVVEKPPSSLAPPSALQSQPKSVASAHSSSSSSSSSESESTSDSDSSSDSETESSSSDSEANDPPRASAPEPDPPTSNKWQLDNWLTKVNPPAVPTENLSEIAHGDGCEKDKEQRQGVSSNSSHQHAEPRQPHHKSSDRAARAPQGAHLLTKHNCQKSPVRAEEPSPRQTVGIKRPSKAPVHKESKGSLKVESNPGPIEVRGQSSRDKPKVKTKGEPKSSDRKDLKPAVQENRKHKSSQQANAKPLLDPRLMRDVLLSSAQEHLPLSPLPQGEGTTPTGTSNHRPDDVAREDFHKEKFPVPLMKRLLSPLRDSPSPQSLMVKIDLPLLSRVPQAPGKDSHQKKPEAKECPGARKQELERKTTDTPDQSLQKRKREVEEEINRKKMKSEKETKSVQSSANSDSSKLKPSKALSETQKKDLLLPPPLPPVSPAHPAPKPTPVAQKRPRSESSEMLAEDDTARKKGKHIHPLSSRRKEMERNRAGMLKDIKGSAGDVTNTFPVPSLPNGTSKPRRPRLKVEKQHPVDYYIEEAKRLKHKADAMTDKTGKAFQYLDATLSFIEYGIALESDATAPKSAYSIVSDTIQLVKYIMILKSFTDSSASSHDKIFAVLCMRCQSILHMAMFRYKKDTAIKYSRILNDHFKSSSKVTQAPSPHVARSTGMPSPVSPMPSPAGSVSSQPGSNASNCSGNSSGSSVTVPPSIPSITSSYVNITSYILCAYKIWEQADALARKNKEFFAELSTATCSLALNSSMAKLVHYTRQGLHWLRLETNMP